MDELIVAIDEAGFRKALSHFASGVTVVTTELDGERFGMTVSAFSSVSLEPPLVLICIEKGTRIHDSIARAERFAVNVLADEQQDVSDQFASRMEDRFSGVELRQGRLKVPVLERALAVIECRLHATLPGGDHTVYVGEVVGAELGEGRPLIYYRGTYHTLAESSGGVR
ncbi:MAG TPA: flavin reductase family protein [Thermoanaerobaculia bacterium]|nr:flavin reductase family protein [Thermoanaerobaculia bacterium]